MKLRPLAFVFAVTLVLTLSYSHTSFAASTLSLSSSGNGSFLLQGIGMENVAALDITITYDPATLSNPRVVQGGLISGAMVAVNPNVPGTVRMGIVTLSPIKGAGVIATLAFDLIGNSPGRIIALKARIANSNGSPLPVQAQVVNPPEGPVTASAAPSDQGIQSGTIAPSAPSTPGVGRQGVIGGGIVPSGGQAVTDEKIASLDRAALPEPVQELPVKEPATASQEAVSPAPKTEQSVQPTGQDKTIYTQKSVLDRFREYKGERSVKEFIALFDQEPLIGFRQEPPIALSDGKATVKISFIAMSSGKDTPEIKVKGAARISLKKDPDNTNTWDAELRPDKRAVSAALIVPQERVVMEFPIIVAPIAPVEPGKKKAATKADFELFLHDRGTVKKSRFDMNGDGKRDYVDDYIFTANYIVQNPSR